VATILFAGDWHADAAHATIVIELAARMGVSRVVQTGDFGYWPRHPAGIAFLTKVAARCSELGVAVWFCDGNHEDHSRLRHGSATAPVQVMPSIWWVPRGRFVEWGGRRILFIGGAVSVDKPRRIAGVDWFEEETPSPEQLGRAATRQDIDIVVAHEGLPDTPLRSTFTDPIPEVLLTRADWLRREMGVIADTLNPSLWVHGHWHHRMSAVRGATRVECLNESRGPKHESVLACDLDTLSTWVPEGLEGFRSESTQL
jgi:hypothetical protein